MYLLQQILNSYSYTNKKSYPIKIFYVLNLITKIILVKNNFMKFDFIEMIIYGCITEKLDKKKSKVYQENKQIKY